MHILMHTGYTGTSFSSLEELELNKIIVILYIEAYF